MMTRLLPFTLLLTCAAITAQGQVAFSYPDALPQEGTHNMAHRTAPLPTYSATPPWSFNGLAFGSVTGFSQVWRPAVGTPYAAQMPTATHCLYHALAFPVPYNYFIVNAAGVQQVGFASTGGVFTYSDPWQVFVFPNQVGTGYNDDYTVNGTTAQGISNPLAKGTLLTPYGDFANVVLVEFGFNDGSGTGTVFTYVWFRDTNAMIPIAQYDPVSQQLDLYTPINIVPLSVPEFGAPSVSMGPNPASFGTVRLQWTGTEMQADLRIIAKRGVLRAVHHEHARVQDRRDDPTRGIAPQGGRQLRLNFTGRRDGDPRRGLVRKERRGTASLGPAGAIHAVGTENESAHMQGRNTGPGQYGRQCRPTSDPIHVVVRGVGNLLHLVFDLEQS